MLTQGPAADPKCNLINASFLTLPHLLDCLIYIRNAMSIVLLLQMMGGLDRWGWLIYIMVWVRGHGVGIILWFSCCFFCAFGFFLSQVLSAFI